MMTRINFTGRRRITRDRVRLELSGTDGPPRLDVVRLDLSDLNLPEDAPVVVEAYRRSNYTRIDAGRVGQLALPRKVPLADFQAAAEPLFRVKVVGPAEDEGRLLAVADRLQAHVTDDREGPQGSILTVAPFRLGERLWKLDLTDDEPQVLINDRLADWKGFAATPEFHAFVLPEVLRQITGWVILGLNDDADESEAPRALWARLLVDELGRDPREALTLDEVDRSNWIEVTVEEFCSHHQLFERYAANSEDID